MIFGRRGFDSNRPHGSLYYGVGDAALNASPYSLTGQPTEKPAYLQNSFGGSLGGPLNIPHIYHGGSKTFYFINYNGKRGENPFDQFSTVPTLLERQGNFSQTTYTSGPEAGQPVRIFIPGTNLEYANNTIPQINPAAQGLLQYIPLPNLAGQLSEFPLRHFRQQQQRRFEHTFESHVRSRSRARPPRRRPECSAQQSDARLPLPRFGHHSDQRVSQRGRQHFGPQLRRSGFVHAQHRKADQHCPRGFQPRSNPHAESIRFQSRHHGCSGNHGSLAEPVRLGLAESFLYKFRQPSGHHSITQPASDLYLLRQRNLESRQAYGALGRRLSSRRSEYADRRQPAGLFRLYGTQYLPGRWRPNR